MVKKTDMRCNKIQISGCPANYVFITCEFVCCYPFRVGFLKESDLDIVIEIHKLQQLY